MPIKRDDAKRALELLEDYHARLERPQDVATRADIERVIEIFRSRLFNALLDIQEYYELTLLDDHTIDQQRVADSLQVATKLSSRQSVLGKQPVVQVRPVDDKTNVAQTEEPLPPPPPPENVYAQVNKSASKPSAPSPMPKPATAAKPVVQHPVQQIAPAADAQPPLMTRSPHPPATSQVNGDFDVNWEYEDVSLERGSSGLGFSIAGGTDVPHFGDDPSIFITKLIEGGTAVQDGRMRLNDIILSVNGVSMVDVTHAQSVEILKRSGKTVHLRLKRPRTSMDEEEIIPIDLVKGSKGLGFSIGGGVDNQHIVGDNAIYITKVIDGGAAQLDGRLAAGDKLVAVNDTYLTDVIHEEAVAALKATKERVRLLISKPLSSRASSSLAAAIPQDDEPLPPKKTHKGRAAAAVAAPAAVTAASRHSPEEDIVPTRGGPRKIILKKGTSGLGFNFVGGEDGEGIFVSFILAGGQADLGGELQRGDQLLSVNGIDLREATHEQAAAVLKGSGDRVEIIAVYRPDEFNHFEAKIHDLREQMMNSTTGSAVSSVSGAPVVTAPQPPPTAKKSKHKPKPVYVKALFDYDPSTDGPGPGRKLGFRYGDIFQVVSKGEEEDEWWQAKKVVPPENNAGFIPSKLRVEMQERARLRNVKQSKKLKKKKGKADESQSYEDDVNAKILSYETVTSIEAQGTRPVVILGPLKDNINDDLMTDFPDNFGSCIPHTTRPIRDNEVDGRDYHFVPSVEEMERDIEDHLFIEAGQFGGNLYGTHVESVRVLADNEKHCILDVSGNAIRRLEAAQLYPIVIFIKADSAQLIRQWSPELSEGDAKKAYEKNVKIEEEFGEQFTAIVSGDTAEEIYTQVKEIIEEQSGPVAWIPIPVEEQ